MEQARWEYDDQPKLLTGPKRATNKNLPDPVVLEVGEKYDVIEHPYTEGATAKFWHSTRGEVRCDGSAGGTPGTILVSADVEHMPEFYAGQIKTSERGKELVQARWAKGRQALRDGIKKAVREEKGIPEHLMTSDAATAIFAEMLTKRVLDTNEPLRDVTKTTQFLLEKSQALPDHRSQKDVPEVAIQINIQGGLLSGGFDED